MTTSTAVAIALAVAIAIAFLFFGPSILSMFSNDSSNIVPPTPVSEAPTALGISDVVVGTGEAAQAGDTVTVNYVGRLSDGTVFDASANHGQPYTFVLGQGTVIAGWDQGLVGMQEGGRRVLTVPPSLGYGSVDYGPIPGNSTLIFEVELLQVAR